MLEDSFKVVYVGLCPTKNRGFDIWGYQLLWLMTDALCWGCRPSTNQEESSASFLCERGNPKLIHEAMKQQQYTTMQNSSNLLPATFGGNQNQRLVNMCQLVHGHTMSQRPATCCFPHASSLSGSAPLPPCGPRNCLGKRSVP